MIHEYGTKDNGMKKGLHAYRLQREPKEKQFAEAWEESNKFGHTLEYLLSMENDRDHTTMTDRDEVVAATVIQWLGSPCGQGFLGKLR